MLLCGSIYMSSKQEWNIVGKLITKRKSLGELACSVGDLGSIPGLGRSHREGNGCPLQYSDLENSMDFIVHRVTKSWTQLSKFRIATTRLLIREGNVSKLRDWHQSPHPKHAFWDNNGTRWVVLGHKMIDMNLEERQVSEQTHSLINIVWENLCMSKTYSLGKSLQGDPTSQS